MMGYKGGNSNDLTEIVQSADKTPGLRAKVLQESTNEVNDPVSDIKKAALDATEQPAFEAFDEPTKENKNDSIESVKSPLATEYKEPRGCRRRCRHLRANLSLGNLKKKPRVKKEEESLDPPPGSPWSIEDELLPEPLKYDKFEIWPDGDIQRIYRDYEIRIRGLDNGWVMQDISNDSPNITSKSCMGVLICSEKCTSSTGLKAYKPAVSDKHRKEQIGMRCPTPGCEGKLIHIPCLGHNGSPVIQSWRYYKDRVYFQSKGQHNHARPERKIPTSPMVKCNSPMGARPTVAIAPISSVPATSPIIARPVHIQTNLGEINWVAAIINQPRESFVFHCDPAYCQRLLFNLTPQSNSASTQGIHPSAEPKNAGSERRLSADESSHASKSPENVLSQQPGNTSRQEPLVHDNSTRLSSVKNNTGSHGTVAVENPPKEMQQDSRTEAQIDESQPVRQGAEKQEVTKLSVRDSISDVSEKRDLGIGVASPESEPKRKSDGSPGESLLHQSSSSHSVPPKAPLHPFMIEAILRVPFVSKSTEESAIDSPPK
ncbi:hypothetical protein Aperf_G00000027119 [Anoplocephala perfoliata]